MKIADVRTIVVGNPWKNWIYVVVETDEGLVGIGEATGGSETQPTVAAIEEVKHLVIGMDPRNVHEIFHKLYLTAFIKVTKAISGIEMACWDILGKSLGVPVHTLLGGKVRDNVRVYANGWYSGERTPEGFAEKASEVVAKGYTALKFDPFGDAHMQMSRKETAEAKALIGAVRDAVGDDVDILIEAHDRFSTYAAIEIGNWLKDYDVTWFETPVLSTDISALVEVARRIPVRMIAGERMHAIHEFGEFLSHNVTDVINPEPLGVGGIWRSLQIAGIAEAHHAEIALHNAESPFKTMVALHIDAVTPNVFIQECFDDFLEPWVSDVLTGFHRVEDGYLKMPTEPGIGVTLNEEEAKKHPYGKSNFLRMFRPGWEKRDTAKQE
ncbi:mandelate racemase/muconate lactonizing enzyme family protein [Candidatus Lucifugimonas marina]|jgi:galactonate dehydratase|uniref:Mandelate racemase/muconate lactonizing enzyme family protein n=1 Tax=Candidatus Lucifugimonas marina TaxID=3038979 RepID=A0AAJ6CTS5_9CHLR|nr:mandelate racemase/muconate lactonizing enzyme family protein [SAR202 cluster bacterium JH702]MDG0869277.1 mandelate racemase/muconate lactonizing enzyme family protein [SAR202 cluster bacterium JH639]WFG36679.1 mandelate racemase/muconate lactonizing enzyme family protein [SAR202 cluster bacterium JH545]WFG40613.1 mandelate racemase/muconate lactonizing enzyme family protein [SAR202 cluster bacterium JH1073]